MGRVYYIYEDYEHVYQDRRLTRRERPLSGVWFWLLDKQTFPIFVMSEPLTVWIIIWRCVRRGRNFQTGWMVLRLGIVSFIFSQYTNSYRPINKIIISMFFWKSYSKFHISYINWCGEYICFLGFIVIYEEIM